MLTVSLSVTVAMYCLIQLYVVVSEQLKPHQPLLKLFSVKAVGEGLFFAFTTDRLLTDGHSVPDVLASYGSFGLCHAWPCQGRESQIFPSPALSLTPVPRPST